ncbi:hypothetical protein V6N11_074674 [Hibiscus sabdariffa]|uniref:Reverse transcriptase zinc-binding domain-containing protein n=1 Tax=Hibiscus sabdariffa TaxID=183260 RepID=A0ABR2R479_9ROSI
MSSIPLGPNDVDGRLVTFYNRTESPRPIAIADMTNANGRWDWERIFPFLPESIMWKIVRIKPPSMQFGSELSCWRWEQNRCFTTKSAYDALSAPSGPVVDFKWASIWKLRVPQLVKVFLWLSSHDRLLTNPDRVRRHIVDSDKCPWCQVYAESLDHVL